MGSLFLGGVGRGSPLLCIVIDLARMMMMSLLTGI